MDTMRRSLFRVTKEEVVIRMLYFMTGFILAALLTMPLATTAKKKKTQIRFENLLERTTAPFITDQGLKERVVRIYAEEV